METTRTVYTLHGLLTTALNEGQIDEVYDHLYNNIYTDLNISRDTIQQAFILKINERLREVDMITPIDKIIINQDLDGSISSIEFENIQYYTLSRVPLNELLLTTIEIHKQPGSINITTTELLARLLSELVVDGFCILQQSDHIDQHAGIETLFNEVSGYGPGGSELENLV